MQQYFTDLKAEINREIPLDADSLYHLKKVLRKQNGWNFRIADCTGTIYLAELNGDCALIKENTHENNELDTDITVILALVKSDKFEMSLQKLTELGVKRIVPYNARRSVVEITKNSKLDRFRKIVKEASEQSHRNIIPEVCEAVNLKDIRNYMSKNNYIAYEKEDEKFSDIDCKESVTVVIGPEGGFEPAEFEKFRKLGFKSISLGKRILRAETAAIFMTSLIVAKNL